MPRTWPCVLACWGTLGVGFAAQADGSKEDLLAVLKQAGATAERYFERAQSLICLENVRVQIVGRDLSSERGPARNLQFETRVAWEAVSDGALPEPTTQRQLVKVGGRPPSPKDKPGCMDPKDVSPEPLSILLPENHKDYTFLIEGRSRVGRRPAVVLAYKSISIGPVTAKTTGPDCWSAELPGRARGKFWIDTETGAILRHDTSLNGLVDIVLPPERGRSYVPTMTVERLESSTVYRAVKFREPDETIMLPHTVEKLQVVRNAENVRIRHQFSEYQRFTTSVRIVQD
jgi:hypothetical protein